MICFKEKIKIFRILLVFVFFFATTKGISQNDCVEAILICGNANLSGLTADGIGIQEIDSNNACGSQENNSIWLKIKINTGGTLGFVITPQSTDILEDFDFWIFGPNLDCSNLGTAIRCSTTNPLAINQVDNLTGMNSTETDVSEGPGNNGNSFVKWMNVLDNEIYYIAIDRPSGVSAFTIAWTGTATFNQSPVPVTSNDLRKCNTSNSSGTEIFNLVPNGILATGNQANVVANFFTSNNNAITNFAPIVTPSAFQNTANPQSIFLKLTNFNTGCSAITDFNLLVDIPTVTAFSYISPICINGVNPTVNRSLGFTNGGVFSSAAGLILDAITGTINLTTSIPGTYVVNYSLLNLPSVCLNPTFYNFSITIYPLSTISIPASSQLFCTDTAINPLLFTVGGAVSSVLVTAGSLPMGLNSTFNNGVFSIIGTPTETGTFSYTLSTFGGCAASASISSSMTVLKSAIAGIISGAALVCYGLNSNVLTLIGSIGTIAWQSSTDGLNYIPILGAFNATHTVLNLTTTTYFRAVITNGICTPATTLPFKVAVKSLPIVSLPQDGKICIDAAGNPISTFRLDTQLSSATNSFVWSNSLGIILGQTGNSFTVSAPGVYYVATTDRITGCVSAKATTTVRTAFPPLVVEYSVSSYFSEIQTVTVTVQPTQNYEYKLDSNPYQESNVFTNLSTGMHEIFVRDLQGCGVKKIRIQIVNFPNYFTPNGDSYHDTWNITELRNQLNSYITIFDRYGKLLQQIRPSGSGWDGNYNGNPLPATDYWFTVYYTEQNKSQQFSSHFSLKR